LRKIIINANKKYGKISKNIYGHFSEHLGRGVYEGIYVGEKSIIPNEKGIRTDVVSALRDIKAPVLRWPGGCFADEYHWMDGIGLKHERKKMINTHWGGVVEDNSFGTHEFMELCEQVGCAPFISGNIGSGTVREMSEWVEYMTFDGISPMADLRRANGRQEPWEVPYFGIGNETWGCGGNMCADYYAGIYRHYQTYVREYGNNKIAKIACGPNIDDYNWTEVLMNKCHSRSKHTNGANYRMDGLSLHYYTCPGGPEGRGSAEVFDEEKYFHTLSDALRMDELITEHSHIMDRYDPENKVGLIVDEWGTWFDVAQGTNPGFLYQQNTMRDALVAGLTLNIFNKNCRRVVMANLAQTVNVLQSVLLTKAEKIVKTPTYHVFDLYKHHHDAVLLDSHIETRQMDCGEHSIPDMQMSASLSHDGKILATPINLSPHSPSQINMKIEGFDAKEVKARVLKGKTHDYNDFDDPEHIKPTVFENIELKENGSIEFILPPCSIMEIIIA